MNSKERTKTKTRSGNAPTRGSLTAKIESQDIASKGLKSTIATRNGMTRPSTMSSGAKEGSRRKTYSLKPLCQRSQQRHEVFQAEFQQKVLDNKNSACDSEVIKNRTRKSTVPRSIAGGSLPPRLPSVKKTATTPSVQPVRRKQWCPKPSPEPPFRPRSVREKATKERFLQQPGARPLNLSPPAGTTTSYDNCFDSISPTVYNRGASCGAQVQQTRPNRSKWHNVHGTTPPADAEVDSEHHGGVNHDNSWRSPQPYNRFQNRMSEKQQYRLKSQQYQVQKMQNVYRARSYDVSYHEVDSPLALYDRGDEEFEFA